MIYLLRMICLLVVLTGLIHIFSIFATPFFADDKIWQRIKEKMEPRNTEYVPIHADVLSLLGQADPAMAYAFCRFDLNNGPVNFTADGPTEFWNVTIFNRDAEMIYSLHDSVSRTKQLKLQVTSSDQILKKQAEAEEQNVPLPSSVHKDPTIPAPQSRPLTDRELAAAKAEAEAGEDDGSVIRAVLKINQAFLVMKMFRSSSHYSKLVAETLERAECK